MKMTLLLLASLLLLSGVSYAQQKEVLTNKSVIDLYKAGLDNEVIVSKIESSDCRFDLSTAGLLNLKKAAVPSDIMKAMLAKAADKPAGSSVTATPPPPAPVATKAYPDIDLINIPYSYDSKSNSNQSLEKSVVSIKGRITLGSVLLPAGVSSPPITFKIDKEQASIRMAAADNTVFLINCGIGTPDIFKLYHLTIKKGKREGLYMKEHVMKMEIDNSVVPFTYKKVKEGIYQIIPTTKLAAGEYCFMNDASIGTYGGTKADVYAFGID